MHTRLLTCGIVAGPIFLTVWAAQALTRDGFDPARHPISLLALGEAGWVQIASFVLTGALYVAFAAGLRRVWGAAWITVTLVGVGLVMAGVFTTDPGAGFPPGAPAGAPEQMSWHGVLHEVGFVLTAGSWLAACVVLARRFARGRERAWTAASVAAPLVVIAVLAWPDLDSLALRMVLGTAIQFAYLSAVAARATRTVVADRRVRLTE